MKQIIHIVLWLLPLTCLSQQYYIKGKVTDEAGNGIGNASVLLHSTGYKYYTGTEGLFAIIGYHQLDTVTITKDGFIRETFAIKASQFSDLKMKKITVIKSGAENKLSSWTQNLTRDEQRQWFVGEETYASLVENNFVSSIAYPLTSITLNVDRASYSNVRRFLNTNSLVPPDAVRIEEMLNYFNFNYEEPADGKTFSLRSTFTECPWNKKNRLLFVQVNAKKLKFESLPPTHLVFLIDVSGSMDLPNRLPLLKSGFKLLVNNLRPVDSVSVVVYGGTVGLALETTGGDEKEKITRLIDSLEPGGSTPGESGIKLAYNMARNHFIKGGNNRVILATDGDFNVGLKTEDELERLIVEQKAAGVYLTCIGVGMGNYKDSKIQTLAQRGNGNFAYLDSYAEAEKVLLKEFAQTLYTVADQAYLNVRFDPHKVAEYRLIGYDNKYKAIIDSLAVIEGGEIGSGYSNLIAFEIVPAVDKLDELSVEYVLNYKVPEDAEAVQEKVMMAPKLVTFRNLQPDYQFASSVIMFGGLLKKSKYIKTSWSDIGNIARSSSNSDHFAQVEFIKLIEQAKRVYSRKKRMGHEY